MFKKTDTTPQYDLFSRPSTQLGKRGSKKYDDAKAWHNQFYRMSLIKEGFGCSDEDLFDKCEFDLLVRKALGLLSLSDSTPSLDTYYLLRRRICQYEIEEGVNLMEKCFAQLTSDQLSQFKISCKSVRMDSKLIGSNIAWYSRFEIIHNTFRHFLKDLGESRNTLLNPKLLKLVEAFEQEDAQKMVYRLNNERIGAKLSSLGLLVSQVLKCLNEKTIGYDFLHRFFHEQYEVVKGVAIPRPKEEISAQSVQNHNDPDTPYRKKGAQRIRGYSVNITETCNDKNDQDGKPNLIADVQVNPVSAADNDYVQDAVTHIENNVTDDKIETLYADGAYQSSDNRRFADTNHIELMITGLQGRQSIYDLEMKDGNLIVTNLDTEEIIPAHQTSDKWRITTNDKSKYKYFTVQQIENSALKRKLASITIEEQMKRNNVEATMFQYCFHSRNNKTRYRGLLKHKLYSYARCLWMNHVRLMIYLITICQGTTENGSKANFRDLKDSVM